MINRNNYEEYLLMYLDGELSSQQRKDVELFIQQHPDLQEEFSLLQQAVLQPEEELVFTGRESLYRKETGISLNNYKEYFFLYIDNELSSAEKEMVETFVLQQPTLQEEFTQLKQIVLPQENISFGNKEVLYRKEQQRRPVVISMRWASLAAAVLIGVVVMVMFTRNGTEQPPQVASGQEKPSKPATDNVTSPVETTFPSSKEQITTPVAGVNNSTSNNKQQQPLNKRVKNNVTQEVEVTNRQQDQQVAITIPHEIPATNTTGHVTVPSDVLSVTGETKVAVTGSSDNRNNYVQPAVYTETIEAEEDNSVYVGSIQVNPDKVRGFLRKATRFISSKVKSDDDNNDKGKIRVASLEMNKIK